MQREQQHQHHQQQHHNHTLRSHPLQLLQGQHAVTTFKKKHHLASGRTKKLKSKALVDNDENNEIKNDGIADYHDEVLHATENYDPSLIINADETRLDNTYISDTSIHYIGQPAIVNAQTNTTGGHCTTIIGATTLSGRKLPLFLVKKGVTDAIFDSITKHRDLILQAHTSNWVNTDCFLEYLNKAIKPYTNGENACLIIDSSSVHLTDEVMNECDEWNIELIYVPKNHTATCQPLDVGVFGPAKSSMKARLHKQRIDSDTDLLNFTSTIEQFYQSWHSMSRRTIIKSFKDACNL